MVCPAGRVRGKGSSPIKWQLKLNLQLLLPLTTLPFFLSKMPDVACETKGRIKAALCWCGWWHRISFWSRPFTLHVKHTVMEAYGGKEGRLWLYEAGSQPQEHLGRCVEERGGGGTESCFTASMLHVTCVPSPASRTHSLQGRDSFSPFTSTDFVSPTSRVATPLPRPHVSPARPSRGRCVLVVV